MTLLITGKQGQLARCLEVVATQQGLNFFMSDRSQMDLLNPVGIESQIKNIQPVVVINTAAFTDVEAAEHAPESLLAVNSRGPGNLATVCSRYNIPLIHLSTDYVFDGKKATGYSETSQPNPINAYGKSKLKGEQLVAKNHHHHIILRTAWLHSPYGTNFVKSMLHLARKKPELNVVNDQFGCPTYGIDLATGILRISQLICNNKSRSDIWGLYNLTNTGSTNWYELAKFALAQSSQVSGSPTPVNAISSEQFEYLAPRPANSILDCGKIQKTLNISLPSWQNGVSRCVAEILNQQKTEQNP